MNRRAGIRAVASGLLAAALASHAATPRKTYRIGVLAPSWEGLSSFEQALRAVGYEEGRNAEFVVRRADSQEELDALATELVASKVDVIAASSTREILAAKRATSTIPIVMIYGVAPVELGLIDSLARPGGNVTGTAAVPLELAGKAIEIFRNTVPRLRRLTVLIDLTPTGKILQRETERAAQALGIETSSLHVHTPADLDSAFVELQRNRPDGVTVRFGLVPQYREVIRFAALHRLPAIYAVIPAVRWGGLMAYSPNLPAVHARTAAVVDRILQGTKPKDVPVEQPTRYVLAINLKTAKELALTIPQSVLVRADIVVE
jgi:putative ABC transport system substrate-binding protein